MPPRRLVPAWLAAGLVSTACSGAATPAAQDSPVQVSVSACGTGWTDTHAGPQDITVHNTDSRPGEAQLIDPRSGAVYADVEPLGPGTSDTVRVSLSAGTYAWRCLMEDEGAVTGTPAHITGPAHGTTPGVVPVSEADLVPATQAYERYVRTQLPTLRRLTDQLRADVDRNRFARGRRDWLTAHSEYERLGAAYDAFGTLDSAINGLPDGLPGGIHDARWTGFHRVEYGLWHDESRASLLPYVDLLTTDVARLQHRFASAEIDPLQISIRAHEISENALQFVMTGRTDFGSHSQRSTVSANLQGTAVVLQIIHPLIAPRYPQLPQTLEQLQRARRDVRHADHERLDSDLSQLCELLAPIAAILEPRRTS